jgi:hypothetical protein
MGPGSKWQLVFDIFSNTFQTANKGWSSILSVMHVVNTFILQKSSTLKNVMQGTAMWRHEQDSSAIAYLTLAGSFEHGIEHSGSKKV